MAGPRAHLYRRKDGRWAWNVKAVNGEVVATDGGQGYENYTDALNGLRAVVGAKDQVTIDPRLEDFPSD